ncbi:MAG: anti-sigma factor [Desulfuromonas sp.]|nr:MAG: anti-sigma factor [Desulfuromonas sp.]
MTEKLAIDIKVPNQTRYLSLIGKIGEDIARTIKRYNGDREELAYQVNLVLTEATSNAILHAESCLDDREIHINISIINKDLHIKVYDQGKGFDLKNVPSPDFGRPEESGRGVYIIQSIMDKVDCSRSSSGHVLEMIKHLH